ncbi:malto-oligosyltrehalose synthase [soil metagenome]
MTNATNPRIPSATYRLQFHAGFTFKDAREILEYLDALGISDVYASPYFQAAPESTHGYDVSNHNRINPEIGDDSDFRAYTADLRQRNMGQILDFVPNHMGIGQSLNQWWMEVLEDGIASPYSRYFDIDWNPGKRELEDRVLLPVLGERYGKALENGEFKLSFEDGVFSLHYFDTVLPISPATYPIILRSTLTELEGASVEKMRSVISAFAALSRVTANGDAKTSAKAQLSNLAREDPQVVSSIEKELRTLEGRADNADSFDALHDLLEQQVYRLAYWRVAAEEINYRRFFDINTLAAIRVEIPEVFAAAHQLVFMLLSRGDVTGLRIDHVDGLWDPKEYLDRLQERYGQLCGTTEAKALYLVVEKILDLTRERLPEDWQVHGTTGYEFTNQMVQFFTDAREEKRFTKIYHRFTGVTQSFVDMVYEKKKLITQLSLNSEVVALGRLLNELSEIHRNFRDLTLNMLTTAVREVIVCFPVYRTYATPTQALSDEDEKIVLRAISMARRRNPAIEKHVFDFLRSVLLLRLPERLTPEEKEAHIRFVMKFQQCSGPVMAKGLEDTTFYIFNRLAALNEVGGNPGQFGLTAVDFHRLNEERAARTPHSMLATTTHDTKRSEDARMRMVTLSEMPDEWQAALKRWNKWNRKLRTKIGDEYAPSANEEYLIYQTLLGTWPVDSVLEESTPPYTERIQQYMLKAMKEAKVNSSWTEPFEEWEKAVTEFAAAILDQAKSGAFLADLATLAEEVARLGALNSLSQTVMKCTLPGVPDFYQGSELWDLCLVDPDNRRPVDYTWRKQVLSEIQEAHPAELMEDWKSGRIKLFVIQRLLSFRRQHANFFQQADYCGLKTSGRWSEQICAFLRTLNGAKLLVIAPRLIRDVPLPLTGEAWGDTSVKIELGDTWKELLTGTELSISAAGIISPILSQLPFAVLYQRL